MYWAFDWVWGLPLLVITITFHIYMFVLMERKLIRRPRGHRLHRRFPDFIAPLALIGLGAALLHGAEAAAWAALYVLVGALPEPGEAILYSLNAITSYGHTEIFLAQRWRLLGAIEAMNGLILFGLTTAFLYAAIGLARAPVQS
jgi:hypothetical protein